MKRYALTRTAEVELDRLLEHIAERDGVDRALHVLDSMVEAFELLASTPGIGVVRPHLTSENIRWWTVFKFLIVYDASSSPLMILRIVHGERDLPRLFGEL